MQTDGYLPHVLCARDHIGYKSRLPPQREAKLLRANKQNQKSVEAAKLHFWCRRFCVEEATYRKTCEIKSEKC